VSNVKFEVDSLGNDCYAINDRGRTVATVSGQGFVDWILRSPMQDGERIQTIKKETHMGYVLGLKFELAMPNGVTHMGKLGWNIEQEGKRLVLTADSASADGKLAAQTVATLRTDALVSQYEWELTTTLTSHAKEGLDLKTVEFNNVYPSRAGLCMLYAPQKQYDSTLMVDAAGVVWKFPHQHMMHYGRKTDALKLGQDALSGFFGEKTGSPVVMIQSAAGEPTFGICDMYYDLHCCAKLTAPLLPGASLQYRYIIKYLSNAESQKLLGRAKAVAVTAEDHSRCDYPRFELGLNQFDRGAMIDRADDCSGFRPRPPKKVWDRQVGHKTKGSLRITNEIAEETVWTAEPPNPIPSRTQLTIRAMIKTQGVEGKGAFIRVRYHTFEWRPKPHVVWAKVLETDAVSGTSEGWTKVAMPPLTVPEEEFDYLVAIDAVLDGKGVAWITDVDVDLQPLPAPPPALEVGSKGKRQAATGRRATASSGAEK